MRRLDLPVPLHHADPEPDTFLYNTGPINTLTDDPTERQPDLHRHQRGPSTASRSLGTNLPTPPNNIGPRSTPNYAALAEAAVQTAGGIKVFAGQRDDPFFVDLGSVFDLGGLRHSTRRT